MKAKTKFLKFFYKLPKRSRTELVYNYAVQPMTLSLCCLEIRNDTERGRRILKDLGFEDD